MTGVANVEVGSAGQVARAGVICRWLGWDGVAWGGERSRMGWSVFCVLLLVIIVVVFVCCSCGVCRFVLFVVGCDAGVFELCLFCWFC